MFVQNLPATGWGAAQSITTVHRGAVCEAGFTCQASRQLFDDFGVATDASGWAHIAYSHDAPDLGRSGTYTGYAVQVSGSTGIPADTRYGTMRMRGFSDVGLASCARSGTDASTSAHQLRCRNWRSPNSCR